MLKSSRLTITYSLVQATTWSFYAILLGFSSNFLYHFGFQDSQIGLLLGISTAAACVLQLAAAEVISRWKAFSIHGVLLGMGLAVLLSCLSMLNPWSDGLAVAGLALACAVHQAIPAMSNAIAINAIERGAKTNYSVARGFGSAAYSLIALITGRLVVRFGVNVIPIFAVFVTAAFLFSVICYHTQIRQFTAIDAPNDEKHPRSGNFLLRRKHFALFLLGCILLFISHNLLSNFMLQIISAKGGNASHQGTATAISALVELPVMFGFALLLKLLCYENWVQFSVIFFSVKALGLYFAGSPLGVYAAQSTQLLGYAIFGIASVNYARLAVDAQESVRAQSYLASTASIGSLIASAAGGVLCQYLGIQTMILVSAGFAVVGAIIVIWAVRIQKASK